MQITQYPWTNPYGAPDCDPELSGILAGGKIKNPFSKFILAIKKTRGYSVIIVLSVFRKIIRCEYRINALEKHLCKTMF